MISELPKNLQDEVIRELSAGHFVTAKEIHDNFMVTLEKTKEEPRSIPVGFQEAGEARASSRSGAYIQYVSSEWQQQRQSLKGDQYILHSNINLLISAWRIFSNSNFFRTLIN